MTPPTFIRIKKIKLRTLAQDVRGRKNMKKKYIEKQGSQYTIRDLQEGDQYNKNLCYHCGDIEFYSSLFSTVSHFHVEMTDGGLIDDFHIYPPESELLEAHRSAYHMYWYCLGYYDEWTTQSYLEEGYKEFNKSVDKWLAKGHEQQYIIEL